MPDRGGIAAAARRAVASRPDRRIIRLKVGEETAWLKNFAQTSPAKWSGFQRAAAFVTRLELLRPVPTSEGADGATHEMAAIQRIQAAGARVPGILWSDDHLVVLSDAGETLRSIEARDGETAIEGMVLLAAQELSRIHSHGVVHGRPILRNLTWDGASVGFIDFEEQPLAVMPMQSAMARDILLLLMSAGRRGGTRLTHAAFAAYVAAGLLPDVGLELGRAARLLRPLAGGIGSALARSRSRDIAGLLNAAAALVRAL